MNPFQNIKGIIESINAVKNAHKSIENIKTVNAFLKNQNLNRLNSVNKEIYNESNSKNTTFKELSAEAQLTRVLERFRNPTDVLKCYSCETLMAELFLTDHQYMDSILFKLKEDGFISNDPILARGLKENGSELKDSKEPIWFITLNGINFSNKGAYLQREADTIHQRVSLENDVKRTKNNEKWLKRGAVGAAIGSLSYLIWDILKYLFENYPSFPCWSCL